VPRYKTSTLNWPLGREREDAELQRREENKSQAERKREAAAKETFYMA